MLKTFRLDKNAKKVSVILLQFLNKENKVYYSIPTLIIIIIIIMETTLINSNYLKWKWSPLFCSSYYNAYYFCLFYISVFIMLFPSIIYPMIKIIYINYAINCVYIFPMRPKVNFKGKNFGRIISHGREFDPKPRYHSVNFNFIQLFTNHFHFLNLSFFFIQKKDELWCYFKSLRRIF